MVTGSITISGGDPRQFGQTFFISRQYQYKDGYNYFICNEILRFLEDDGAATVVYLRTPSCIGWP